VFADAPKKERRSAGGHHPAMDLGDFEAGIDLRGDLDQVPLASKAIEESAQARRSGPGAHEGPVILCDT
jgi:hypothetical protein